MRFVDDRLAEWIEENRLVVRVARSENRDQSDLGGVASFDLSVLGSGVVRLSLTEPILPVGDASPCPPRC